MTEPFVLDCGHAQRVSQFRVTYAAAGDEQFHAVWCVECEDWGRLAPLDLEPEVKEAAQAVRSQIIAAARPPRKDDQEIESIDAEQ